MKHLKQFEDFNLFGKSETKVLSKKEDLISKINSQAEKMGFQRCSLTISKSDEFIDIAKWKKSNTDFIVLFTRRGKEDVYEVAFAAGGKLTGSGAAEEWTGDEIWKKIFKL